MELKNRKVNHADIAKESVKQGEDGWTSVKEITRCLVLESTVSDPHLYNSSKIMGPQSVKVTVITIGEYVYFISSPTSLETMEKIKFFSSLTFFIFTS